MVKIIQCTERMNSPGFSTMRKRVFNDPRIFNVETYVQNERSEEIKR